MITIDLTMPLHIVNMLVLIVLMNAVLYRPIRSILLEREKKVAGLREDIENFEKNAKLRLEEFDQKMSDARSLAKGEFDTVKAAAVAASNEKLAGIRAEADAEKSDQVAKIGGEFSSAQKNLQEQLAGFAGEMAGKILGRAV